MNGPVPTTKVFLSEIASLPLHSKVRFLGCVRKYDISAGHLILEHNYPRVRGQNEPPAVRVDINVLFESLKADDLRIGTWLNVLGYVRESPQGQMQMIAPISSLSSVFIEAVMIFPAGAVRIGEYERILQDVHEIDQRVKRPVDKD
ncbi:hypothetical protein Plec18167_000121 [Paecilomyces lecythidis]|uniref:CST complex subunit Ten1 n=1 Tax=Paecilomyces lecythidis TaxID=3004212 RepID=A0ABR3YEF9_9EURO